MNEWMDEWMDGWMNGWAGGKTSPNNLESLSKSVDDLSILSFVRPTS